jgi:hypothetical protein
MGSIMAFDLRPCSIAVVDDLCRRFHGYGGAGRAATYAFAVYEKGEPVAAYSWQPPPFGAARSVCPEMPQAVLALSRMVAVPKSDRALKHVSKPLRKQMRALIDRRRWPVLVTYSDEGQGHTGYVYACSGWTATKRSVAAFYTDASGRRASVYANGKTGKRGLIKAGTTIIQRWEHWACPIGQAAIWLEVNGWHREAIPGKSWSSGQQAYRIVHVES